MKLLSILLVMLLPLQWEPDFATAKKIAKDKNELILLNFSGSDWCGPCIAMRKEYFENGKFVDMAASRLVLVNADFPRRKKNALTTERQKSNDELAEKYNKNGQFPLTLLLDPDGKVLYSWAGKPEKDPNQWIEEVKNKYDAHHK